MNHSIAPDTPGRVFIVLNPKSGNAGQAEAVHAAVAKHLPAPQWTCEFYEITGEEDLAETVREACANGATLVIAAGGDGTVVGVANGLIHSGVPMGVVPLGTGNDLARILGVPLDLEGALQAIAADPVVIEMDALKVGDHYYLSNVSVGVSPHIMKDTSSAQKQRFGLLAYVWTTIRRLHLFRHHRYRLTIDGRVVAVSAAEVLVSNTSMLQSLAQVFGPPAELQDRQLEVYLVTARTWRDYLRMAWEVIRPHTTPAELKHWTVQRTIRLEALGSRRLVQADGEVIGHTPVEVELVTKALRVAMPQPAAADAVEPAKATLGSALPG